MEEKITVNEKFKNNYSISFLNLSHDTHLISYKLYSNKILDRKPECEYGAWEDWNDCTTTNGPGVKTRDRKALTIDCVSPIKTYEINKIKQNNFCMEKYESKRKIIFWQIYHLN